MRGHHGGDGKKGGYNDRGGYRLTGRGDKNIKQTPTLPDGGRGRSGATSMAVGSKVSFPQGQSVEKNKTVCMDSI